MRSNKIFISARQGIWTIISLLFISVIGFYTKFYSGPAAAWVSDSLSGVCYEIFWCLLVFFFVGKGRPLIIATSILIVTCVLEFLQLSKHPSLEFIRSFFIGRALIGTSFTWSDFPYYVLGCGLGWFWMIWLQSRNNSKWLNPPFANKWNFLCSTDPVLLLTPLSSYAIITIDNVPYR